MEMRCRKKHTAWCRWWQRSGDQVQGVKNRSVIERKRSSSGSHGSGRTIHSVQGHRTANGLQESCFDEASSVDERYTKLFHQKDPRSHCWLQPSRRQVASPARIRPRKNTGQSRNHSRQSQQPLKARPDSAKAQSQTAV